MLGKDLREIVAVFVGGAIGTIARAGLGTVLVAHKAAWPWPTFIVNMVAAFALGYFTTRLLERLPPSSYRRPLLGTGFCGGLSTFSTMQIEVVKLFQDGAWHIAIGYTAASIIGGLAMMQFASAMARRTVVWL